MRGGLFTLFQPISVGEVCSTYNEGPVSISLAEPSARGPGRVLCVVLPAVSIIDGDDFLCNIEGWQITYQPVSGHPFRLT